MEIAKLTFPVAGVTKNSGLVHGRCDVGSLLGGSVNRYPAVGGASFLGGFCNGSSATVYLSARVYPWDRGVAWCGQFGKVQPRADEGVGCSIRRVPVEVFLCALSFALNHLEYEPTQGVNYIRPQHK